MRIGRLALGIALCIILAIIPLLIKTRYFLHILIVSGIYVVLALSYDLIVGQVGAVSLAHPAFFGIGAYTVGILTTRGHVSFPLALVMAGLMAFVGAFVIGIPSFQLSAQAFAVGTMGFALIAQLVAKNWISLTEGPMCTTAVPRPEVSVPFGLHLRVTGLEGFYYLIWGLALLTLLFVYRIHSSRIGRTFHAVRDNELLAKASGIDTLKYKMLAFTVGGAIAGVAGGYYSSYATLVCPEDMGLAYTINLLVIVYLGGVGTLRGVIMGALVFTALPEFLRIAPSMRLVIYGSLLLIASLYAPRGLEGLLAQLEGRFDLLAYAAQVWGGFRKR